MSYIWVELIVVLLILGYGFVLSRLLPEKLHLISNLAVSIAAIAVALQCGLSLESLGLTLHATPRGILVAILASLGIMFAVWLLTVLPFTRRYFLQESSVFKTAPSRIAYETAVRIPLSTALSEEILFRGILFAVFLLHHSTLQAALYSSIIFGFWHIFPSLNAIYKRYYQTPKNPSMSEKTSRVAADVAATAIAGMFFTWLRVLSGSLIAPWLVHWTINGSSTVSVLFAKSKTGKR